MMALWSVVTVLYRPAVAPDQPWASRRLVPFVLPGLILGGIWAADLAQGPGRPARPDQAHRRHDRLLLRGLDAHPDRADHPRPQHHRSQRLSTRTAWRSARSAPASSPRSTSCARAFGPDASVVILDSLTADRFAQVIRGMCGLPAAVLTDPNARPGQRRSPASRASAAARCCSPRTRRTPRHARRQVVNLLTTQEAHNLTAPPTRTWLIHYTVWMSRSRLAAGPSILAAREHLHAQSERARPARLHRAALLQRGRARPARGRADLHRHGQERAQLRAARRRRRLDRPDAGPAAPRRTRLPEPAGRSRSAATAAPAPYAASAPSRPAATSWSGPTPT